MLDWLLWGLFPLAASGAGGNFPGLAPEVPLWPQVLKILGPLALLVGGLFLLAALWKRFVPKVQPQRPGIRILATHYLTPKQALFVVAVGEETFLLASSAHNLSVVPLTFRPQAEAGEGEMALTLMKT